MARSSPRPVLAALGLDLQALRVRADAADLGQDVLVQPEMEKRRSPLV
jgi:hypothetical protein